MGGANKLEDLLAPLPVGLPCLRHRGGRHCYRIASAFLVNTGSMKNSSHSRYAAISGPDRQGQRRRITSQRPRLSRLAREPAT